MFSIISTTIDKRSIDMNNSSRRINSNAPRRSRAVHRRINAAIDLDPMIAEPFNGERGSISASFAVFRLESITDLNFELPAC